MSTLVSESSDKQTIFVLRHGDRYDFNMGSEAWGLIAQRENDPPLSDMGLAQTVDNGIWARDLAQKEPNLITKVITSPFLRCIQTCNPIAGAFDTPLLIDNSLWEIIWTAEDMPSLEERASYFPRVDLSYESCFRPAREEPFPVEAMERYARAAKALCSRFMDGTDETYANSGYSGVSDQGKEGGIAICSHAAGVVTIVAQLLNVPMRDVPAASPSGIYRLDREGGAGNPWVLHQDYRCNTDHHKISKSLHPEGCTEGATHPWPVPSDQLKPEQKKWGSPSWADDFLSASDDASWLKK